MHSIEYKRADIHDIDLLIDYRVEFLAAHFGPQDKAVEQPFRTEMRSYLEQTIPNNTYICYYAVCDNVVAGIGGMVIRQRPGNFINPAGRDGYIMSMYTLPEYRRRGIAINIVNLLVKAGKALGVNVFELHATEEGEPVYIKDGFKKHREPTYRKYL